VKTARNHTVALSASGCLLLSELHAARVIRFDKDGLVEGWPEAPTALLPHGGRGVGTHSCFRSPRQSPHQAKISRRATRGKPATRGNNEPDPPPFTHRGGRGSGPTLAGVTEGGFESAPVHRTRRQFRDAQPAVTAATARVRSWVLAERPSATWCCIKLLRCGSALHLPTAPRAQAPEVAPARW
jgi:hypothetical protein